MVVLPFLHVMKGAILFVGLMLVACSPASQVTARPSPSLSASAGRTSTATPSDLPLATVSFSCRLPISTPDGQGAFVSFPAGTVSFDPQGQGLVGHGGAYYDRAFSRWLPVSREGVSPDGKFYAFGERAPEPTKLGTVHVVNVATGSDHVFETPEKFYPYWVLDYTSEGIYLTFGPEGPASGLWLMNPSNGTITRIAQLDYVEGSAGNRIFWLGSVNPGDLHPIGALYAFADQLDRYTLADGSRVTWLYRAGKGVALLGMDMAGHPIVGVMNSEYQVEELVLVLDPKTHQTILSNSSALASGGLAVSIPDSHGVWFGSDHGIYLYSAAGGVQKVSNQPGYPANGCF